MRKLFFLFCLIPTFCLSQGKMKLLYDFNQCLLSEKANNSPDIQILNPANCFCGLEQDCIELNNQVLTFPITQDTFFYADFSFGFSILIEPISGNLDILSKMRSCNNDTAWSIIYQSQDSSIVCNFQQGFDKIVQLSAKIDPSRCWQQVMITRSAGQLRLYINGVIKDEENSNFIIRLNSKIPIVFNKSPCSFINRIRAKLDQIILANYGMNSKEVNDEYLTQDEIITQDTLIFLGASFELRAKSNCANLIQWTPSTGLSNSGIVNPMVSPLKQTKYYFRSEQAFCKTLDSILVKVIDTSMTDCAALRLPTAFSPNQDRLNDEFYISNNYIIEKLILFDIFDRNGSLIVHFTNPTDRWDGNWNGTELRPGTYYYRVVYTCKGEEYATKGSFFLMR